MENKSFFKLVTGKADFKHARGKEGQHRTFFVEMLASVTETVWDCFWVEPDGKLACREAMVLFLMENKSFFKLVTGKADFKHARGKEGQHWTFC